MQYDSTTYMQHIMVHNVCATSDPLENVLNHNLCLSIDVELLFIHARAIRDERIKRLGQPPLTQMRRVVVHCISRHDSVDHQLSEAELVRFARKDARLQLQESILHQQIPCHNNRVTEFFSATGLLLNV
jgi:hypothetical protein